MKSLPRIAVVDTETISLQKFSGCIWEIAIITGDPYSDGSGYQWKEYVWHLEPDLSRADPAALRVNRFYERFNAPEGDPSKVPSLSGHWSLPPRDTLRDPHAKQKRQFREPRVAALEVASALANRTLIGAVPNFDTERLEAWLAENGQCGAWKYHFVDVEALVAGYLRGLLVGARYEPIVFPNALGSSEVDDLSLPDWKSTALLEAAGVAPPSETDRHTALGDCRWARDAFCAVYGVYV